MSRSSRLLAFQHHPTSPAGLIAEAADAMGVRITTVDGEHGCTIPDDAADHDGLLLLGGAMSALDDGQCPHFPALLRLARSFAAAGRPMLGICLGAQLLARAFGGRVLRRSHGEFGFVPLRATAAALTDPLLAGVGRPPALMQWHDDSFVPPPGAVRLLASDGCPEQAFRLGDRVWGFQGHLEVTAADLALWAGQRAALAGDDRVADALMAAAASAYPPARDLGLTIARRWIGHCVASRQHA